MSFPPIELYTYFLLCFACFDVVPYSPVVMIMMLQVCDASRIPPLARMLTLGFLLAESGYLSTQLLNLHHPSLDCFCSLFMVTMALQVCGFPRIAARRRSRQFAASKPD
jgi:hypothetical protein